MFKRRVPIFVIIFLMLFALQGFGATYTVQKGDSYFSISQKYGVNFFTLLKENNADASSWLNIGDKVKVPIENAVIVQKGDSYYTISQREGVNFFSLLKLNGADLSSWLEVGDVVKLPKKAEKEENYVTYQNYTIRGNDSVWSIANSFGVTMEEILEINNLNEESILYDGDILKIPIHHIAKKPHKEGYGEKLDWWSEARYAVPIGCEFTVVDLYTQKSFTAIRTVGSGHADCETKTKADTEILKEIWGGSFNWSKRPVLVITPEHTISASASGMFHAGNESEEANTYVLWRSDNYGAGINYDYIKGNGADGHFDIHFLNSIKHVDGETDKTHQKNILIASGE